VEASESAIRLWGGRDQDKKMRCAGSWAHCHSYEPPRRAPDRLLIGCMFASPGAVTTNTGCQSIIGDRSETRRLSVGATWLTDNLSAVPTGSTATSHRASSRAPDEQGPRALLDHSPINARPGRQSELQLPQLPNRG